MAAAACAAAPADAARAERDEHVADALRAQRLGGARGRRVVADRDAGQRLGLGFVDDQIVDPRQQRIEERPCGGGIQQHLRVVRACTGNRARHGGDRHLELTHEQRGPGDRVARRIDPVGIDACIRAGHDDDAVRAVVVDRDRRDPGRRAADPVQVRHVDALCRQRAVQARTERVVADATDHRDRCTEARGRDRLVRALAAVDGLERRAEQRFARHRQARRARDEVDVDAADDGDTR